MSLLRSRWMIAGSPALALFLVGAASRATVSSQPGILTTVAGFGYVARASIDINLGSPGLIMANGAGYTFFSDTTNNVVYGRDPWDDLDHLAGDGLPGFSGDGGPSNSAHLNGPTGVATTIASYATSFSARVYIADTGNHRIRMLHKNKDGVGIIATIAGDGTAAYKGDGGPALQAGFVSPEALALDANGVLYIADRLDHRVRKITPDGTITTVAGTGQPGFSGDGGSADHAQLDQPSALTLDAGGNLYISDRSNNRIRKVTPAGQISTFIGGGTRTDDGAAPDQASIQSPEGITFNSAGMFFFVDGLRIRAIVDGKIQTVAGTGQAGWTGDGDSPLKATFRHPVGIAVPIEESLLITDGGERRIRKIVGLLSPDGYIDSTDGSNIFDDTEATSAEVTLPVAVLPSPDGRALIADFGNRRIRSLEPPHDSTLPPTPYYLYTAAGDGALPPVEGGKAINADIHPPTGIAGRLGGPYYFSAGEAGKVWEVDPAGFLHAVSIPGLVYPMGLATGTDGRLYVSDRDAARVWEVDAAGSVSVFAGTAPGDSGDGGPANQAQLSSPEAVAVAPNGSVYIADTGNHEVKRVDPDGSIHTVAGTGKPGYAVGPWVAKGFPLDAPEGVAVDSDGTLYISDSLNNRIVRINAAGQLEPVAGGPDPGFPKKDPLTNADLDEWAGTAKLFEPAGLAFDGASNLYIADRRNHRIRVLWDAAAAHLGPQTFQPGDVNEDGKVNVKDAILTLQIAVKLFTPTADQLHLADVAPHPGAGGRPYGDGRVDATDAIRILQRSLGFITDDQWP